MTLKHLQFEGKFLINQRHKSVGDEAIFKEESNCKILFNFVFYKRIYYLKKNVFDIGHLAKR